MTRRESCKAVRTTVRCLCVGIALFAGPASASPVVVALSETVATGAAITSDGGLHLLPVEIQDSDPAETRKTSCARWKELIAENVGLLSVGQRRSFAAKLKEAFAPSSEATKTLEPEAFADLAETILLLDHGLGRDVIRQWFENGFWHGVRKGVVVRLAMLAARPKEDDQFVGSAISGDILEELAEGWNKDADSFSSLDLKNVALAFGYGGDVESARLWGGRAFRKLLEEMGERKTPDTAMLREAADILYRSFQCGKDGSHQEFAMLLARAVEANALQPGPEDYELFGNALGTDECRETLARAFAGVRGEARLAAGKALSWSHRKWGDRKRWNEFVEAKATAAERTGIDGVQWMLLRGYCRALLPDREEPARRAQWIARARSSAKTAEDKLLVLREALEYFHQRKRRDLGDKLIQEMEKDADTAGLARIKQEWAAFQRQSVR